MKHQQPHIYINVRTLISGRKESFRTLLSKVKEESKKANLSISIKTNKIISIDNSNPIQIDDKEEIDEITKYIFLKNSEE